MANVAAGRCVPEPLLPPLVGEGERSRVGAGPAVPPRSRVKVTAPSAGLASPGLELIAVVMTSVPSALTLAPMTTVVWRPELKKSSGQVTVWPLALQPGPRSMSAPL